jgi:lysozyme
MDVSAAQLSRTASNEGFVATAYKDGFVSGVQSYSIGFGHQIQPNEQSLRSGSITREKGLALLKQDSKNVVDFINSHSKKTLNQNQFDAFFDYGYNAGVGALQSEILTLWNSGASAATVANAIKTTRTKYHNTAGEFVVNQTLVSRRSSEAANFLVGYTASIGVFLFIGIALALYYYYIDNNEKFPFLA